MYNKQRKALKDNIRPMALNWDTAMHTPQGLEATMKFLEETGVGTRKWMTQPQEEQVGGFGWRHIRDDGPNFDGGRTQREREEEREAMEERAEDGEDEGESGEVARGIGYSVFICLC